MPAQDYGLFGNPSTSTPINTPGLTYNASNYMLQPVVSSGATDDSTPFNNSNLSYSQSDVDKLPINSYQQSLVNSPSSYYSPMNDASGYDKYLGNPTSGSRGGRGNVGANEEYRDFMADRNASVNRTPDTSPTTSPTGGGSRAQSTGPAPIPQVLISQDLTQRPQTGNIYAPDLSAYNDSSLFNYTGPGGVDEYTYGQGLRTGGADYSIFGSPADIANPYYEGQFAPITQTAPVGPADGAINMNPVQLPGDLPQIEVSSDVSMPGFVGGSLPTDLTYQQTIDEMGIFGPNNPPPSTTFPSPGDNTGLTQNMASSDKEYQDMLNQSLMMDNQLMNQLDSSDPRGGEAELNQNVGKLPQDSSMADNQAQADMAMGNRAGYQDSERLLARDVAAGMADNLETLMEQGTRLQTMYDVAEGRQRAGERENLLQNQDVEAANYQRALDAQKIELDKQRYNTQISNPTADFSGYMRNYGSGFKEPAPVNADASQAELDKARYNAQISNPTADFSGYMRNYGSGFVEPQASISDVTDATPMQFANNAGQMEASNANIFNEGKTGPSGKNATDVKIENADKIIENLNRPFREQENTSLFSSFNPIDIALRLASGGDVTENAIAAHRANKEGDFGDGLKHYKDENLQMLDGSIYQPVSDATDGYHFRSGKDAGKLSGSQDLTLGGLPMAAGSWLYQQANGLLDGTLGSNANKQAIDNMQGLIASGNAPAVKTLFDNVAAGKARDENIKKSIDDGTFKPGVKAPAKEAKAAKKAESAKKAAAKAKAKAEAQAKAKAEQARSKAAAKAKAEAAAKAKAKKEADEAARKARENARKPTPAPKKVKVSYNRNKPTPVKKSKPAGRGPQPSRPTRTTGSRGGRGNVGARRRLTGGR